MLFGRQGFGISSVYYSDNEQITPITQFMRDCVLLLQTPVDKSKRLTNHKINRSHLKFVQSFTYRYQNQSANAWMWTKSLRFENSPFRFNTIQKTHLPRRGFSPVYFSTGLPSFVLCSGLSFGRVGYQIILSKGDSFKRSEKYQNDVVLSS